MQGKVGVGCAQRRNEVVLEGADGALGFVASVAFGRHILYDNTRDVVQAVALELARGLVVQRLEGGSDAVGLKKISALGVGLDVIPRAARGHELRVDIVGADHDHEVLLPAMGKRPVRSVWRMSGDG